MQIVLASENPGKQREFKELLHDFPIELRLPSEFGMKQIEETGLTFVENALQKARFASEQTQLPAIGDDSGLIVDALNGAPGIYSARYAEPHASALDRINKLLAEMRNVPEDKRTAHFYCVIVLLRHAKDPAPIIAQGRLDGRILFAPRGNKGFGYDPVFYLSTHDCSVAELPSVEKNRISHRGQALKELITILKTSWAFELIRD